MIDIRIDNLEQVIKQLTPHVVRQAEIRTVNELVKKARTLQSKEIRKDYAGVKAGDIKAKTRIIKAFKGQPKPTGVLTQTGRRIPVAKLKHSRLKRGGYSVLIRKGGRFKVKSAFDATVNQQNDSAHTGIFIRKPGAKRLPIKELMGPSVPQMAARQMDDVYRMVEQEAPEIMARNLDFYFKKSEGLL